MHSKEKTGKGVGTIASKVMRGVHVTKKEIMSLAASTLTQRPDRKKRK